MSHSPARPYSQSLRRVAAVLVLNCVGNWFALVVLSVIRHAAVNLLRTEQGLSSNLSRIFLALVGDVYQRIALQPWLLAERRVYCLCTIPWSHTVLEHRNLLLVRVPKVDTHLANQNRLCTYGFCRANHLSFERYRPKDDHPISGKYSRSCVIVP